MGMRRLLRRSAHRKRKSQSFPVCATGRHDDKMTNIHIWVAVFILRANSILCQASCGDKQTVIDAEGGDVLLSVHQTGVKDVSWVSVNGINHLATTGPGGFIHIRDKRYEDRLYGTTDGSLNLTKLTREDQGEYRADILRNPRNTQCVQLYNLTVFRRLSHEDIGITPFKVTGSGTCAVALLCAVNGSGVTISWRRSHGREIPGINDFLHVPDTETNHSFTCIAQNPVSNASRTVNPREYCQQENTDLRAVLDSGPFLFYCFIAKACEILLVGLFLSINLCLSRKQ